MLSDAELQRHVTRLLLDALDGRGFALAGAGAIRAHGLTERPTADIDLFCGPRMSETDFSASVGLGAETLRAAGCEVTHVRGFSTFARLRAVDAGRMFEVDFAMSWRADPPVRLSVGPVLSERDAVAGKLSAVYSRGEIRDFLDLDSIRSSGRYTDETLLDLGREHDAGFDQRIFAAQLSRVVDIRPSLTEQYDVTEEAFAAIQRRLYAWAVRLRDEQEG